MSRLNDNCSSAPPSPLPTRRLLGIAFSIGVALGSGVQYGFSQTTSTINQKAMVRSEMRPIGLAEYERLKIGMTVTEVEAILDRGTEINRSLTTATFAWKNPDGSSITGTFEEGRLKNKKQSDLQ